MRRHTQVLFESLLLFFAFTFMRLKIKKHGCIGELKSDGSEKSDSAERSCMATLEFLNIICLCVDPAVTVRLHSRVQGLGGFEKIVV